MRRLLFYVEAPQDDNTSVARWCRTWETAVRRIGLWAENGWDVRLAYIVRARKGEP
jgi:hypothetical protein